MKGSPLQLWLSLVPWRSFRFLLESALKVNESQNHTAAQMSPHEKKKTILKSDTVLNLLQWTNKHVTERSQTRLFTIQRLVLIIIIYIYSINTSSFSISHFRLLKCIFYYFSLIMKS